MHSSLALAAPRIRSAELHCSGHVAVLLARRTHPWTLITSDQVHCHHRSVKSFLAHCAVRGRQKVQLIKSNWTICTFTEEPFSLQWKSITTMRAAGPWGHKECNKNFQFIQNPQYDKWHIFTGTGLMVLSLVEKQIFQRDGEWRIAIALVGGGQCQLVTFSKELSKSVFHCSVISCEFPAAIFFENTIGKCSKSIHKVLLSFSSSQHPFVWLLKAPQLSGAMLLFDCFLSPELLLVKILAAALVGTFRELPIGSQELRLARAETLSNDGGRNWCFGCLVCNVESFRTTY